MPTLEWFGKEKVVSFDHEVPVRELVPAWTYPKVPGEGNTTDNMVIHGDNLEALKALLPEFEGRVSCVYIDPPYNTGEEKWVYNDNVNDPRIRRWLGEVVGPEGVDLSRHDKWLCMMYPRLKLLRDMLSDDGFMAVSINDEEVSNLGLLLDELFGHANRLACAPWRSEKSGGKEKTALRTGHEYIYFYGKGPACAISLEETSTGPLNLKDRFGKYRKGRELRKWGATSDRSDRPKAWFPITSPNGETVFPYKNDGTEGYWRWTQSKKEMKAILADPENAHWELCPYDDGVSVNGETERWVPYEKIRSEKKSFGWNTWLDGYGTNSDATADVKAMFGDKRFDTPKPLSLIRWIVSLAYDDDAIVLDSFAGSGTTAQAVLDLNASDGGSRRFIAIEMGEYADSITAERVRRTIDGYPDISPKKKDGNRTFTDGTGGGFSFYELGEPILLPDGSLNPRANADAARRYIWFTETRSPLPTNDGRDDPLFLGELDGTGYYLAYDPAKVISLDMDLLSKINRRHASTVVFAETCNLPADFLARNGIIFKKLPRDIEAV